jgi:two-component sensor histidine kinase
LFEGKVRKFAREKRYIHKSGQPVWTFINVSPLWEAGEKQNYNIAIIEDISERKKVEIALEKSLKEKEALLRELQHRVKNSFALITSLVGLEVRRIPDDASKFLLQSIHNRIYSIANLYDLLYKSKSYTDVHLNEYIQQLCNALFRSYSSDKLSVKLETELDDIKIEEKRAVSIGLIINELLTNSFKYAFPEGYSGFIKVSLKQIGKEAHLEITDNGVGLPEQSEEKPSGGLGMVLVNMLIEQLESHLEIKTTGGTSFRFKISLQSSENSKL